MPFLEDQNRLRVDDLNVESGDGSRRLDQEVLEGWWAVGSQETSWELPVWARADPVVQQIVRTKSSPAMAAQSANLRFRSSSRTIVDTEDDTILSDATAATVTSAGAKIESGVLHPQIHEKWQSGKIMLSARTSRSYRTSTREKQQPLARNADKPQRGKKSRSQKNHSHAITRIQKVAQKPAAGTRSHTVTKFYKLDLNGIATMLPNI